MNPNYSKIRFLLWDNDGVLVDTERCYYAAGQQVLAEIGVALTPELFKDVSLLHGKSLFDIAADHGLSTRQCLELRHRRDQLYSAMLHTENIFIPGVDGVIKHCAAHFRMCIVSSSKKNNFYEIHSRTGNLLSYFEFQLLNGDYPRSKPHPDPWQKAMDRFQAHPDECLVIEDSPRGIQAAKRAGIGVIAVESRYFNDSELRSYLNASDFSIKRIIDLPKLLGLPIP
ncbi:MAG: HAD family phosphatase [Deltaproteobacteria bacterium]|nr:HAD family phosphatase [Deltaproteobacteria bacterium]